ncbi:twin-arginine translocase TatA/TatE family subunit, partial [Actinomyces bovis]|uniref:twin-arginine translocase TatA/TatE family subunit n=1 Tax=Actinomyces bovis TaxID=1658 RepID=UPI001558843F
MFGFSGGEFLLIVIVIAVVVGPSRLPEYTRTLTRLVKRLRVFIESTKEQIAEEVGPELADLDFSELDPRQYDPRKIVREALGDDIDAIKKDLTQPFKSVKEAATEASGSAVKEAQEINEADRAKGTLAERIEAKKQEAKAARELSTVEAAGAATAAFVAQRDAQAAKEAAAKEQAAQSEDLQNKDVPEQAALTAAEPEVTEETTQTGTP